MTKRLKRLRQVRPRLSESQVLTWADAHHARTGQWPRMDSGLLRDELGDNWRRVDTALRYGLRGLPGGSSLARLLAERRGKRNKAQTPPLCEEQIMCWADRHYRRTGRWPTVASGPVRDAPGENWRALASALWAGNRGLHGGDTLRRFLLRHGRPVPESRGRPPAAARRRCAAG
jgi:hypothetical protein